MNNDRTPVLRKRRANSRPWSIFIPGSADLKPVWLPTRTSDEIEARKLLEAVRVSGVADAAKAMGRDAMTRVYQRRLATGRNMTCRRAVDDYLATLVLQGRSESTVENAASRLDLWIRSAKCGVKPISLITADDVAPWINGPALTTAYSTRQLQLKILTAFFDWCTRGDRLPQNPCRNMFVRTEGIPQAKLVEKKRAPFTDEEVQRLLASIPRDDWWHGAVLVGKYFGLRIRAAATLEWASVPDLKRLRIFTHKGRVVVDEPLPDELAAWFREWPATSQSGLCFPAGAASRNLSSRFADYCMAAGLPAGKTFQSLRVRVVTQGINRVLDQLGGEERALMSGLLLKHGVAGVQKIVGHVAGSAVTASRYFNPQPV